MDTTKEVAEVSETNAAPLPQGVAKEITLPSGKKATIFHGLGEHAQTAQEIATNDGKLDQKLYFNALMHLLVHIDGEKMRPDEFSQMPMKDYLVIYGEFAQVNF